MTFRLRSIQGTSDDATGNYINITLVKESFYTFLLTTNRQPSPPSFRRYIEAKFNNSDACKRFVKKGRRSSLRYME
jgi:hypothetical protein